MDGGLIRTLQHNSILFLFFCAVTARRRALLPLRALRRTPDRRSARLCISRSNRRPTRESAKRSTCASSWRHIKRSGASFSTSLLILRFSGCESPRRSTIRTGLPGSSRFPSIERRPSHRRDGARSEHGRLDAPDERGCRPVRSLGAGLDANRHRKYQRFGRYGSIPFVDRVRTGKPDRDQLTPGARARGRSRAE